MQEGVGEEEEEERESGVERGWSRGEVGAQCRLPPLLSAHPPHLLVQSEQRVVGIKEDKTQRDKMTGQRKRTDESWSRVK